MKEGNETVSGVSDLLEEHAILAESRTFREVAYRNFLSLVEPNGK